MAGLIKHDGVHVSKKAKQSSELGINNLSGVYVGEVVDNTDSLYTGRIKIRISEFGSKNSERVCLLSTPFGGHTKILRGDAKSIHALLSQISSRASNSADWVGLNQPEAR